MSSLKNSIFIFKSLFFSGFSYNNWLIGSSTSISRHLHHINLEGQNDLQKIPASIYLFKVKNGDTRTFCETSSKLTIKTLAWRYWHRFGVFIVNFEKIPQLSNCFHCRFEQVNADWGNYSFWCFFLKNKPEFYTARSANWVNEIVCLHLKS